MIFHRYYVTHIFLDEEKQSIFSFMFLTMLVICIQNKFSDGMTLVDMYINN